MEAQEVILDKLNREQFFDELENGHNWMQDWMVGLQFVKFTPPSKSRDYVEGQMLCHETDELRIPTGWRISTVDDQWSATSDRGDIMQGFESWDQAAKWICTHYGSDGIVEALPPGWQRGENEDGIYYEEKNRSLPALADTPEEAWGAWKGFTGWSKEYTLGLVASGELQEKLDTQMGSNVEANASIEYWIKRATWFELRFDEEMKRADKADADLAEMKLLHEVELPRGLMLEYGELDIRWQRLSRERDDAVFAERDLRVKLEGLQARVDSIELDNANAIKLRSDADVYGSMSDDGKLKQIEVLVMMIDVNEANDKDGCISEDIANAKKASESLRDVYCKSVGKELILPWEPNYVIHEGFYFSSRRPK